MPSTEEPPSAYRSLGLIAAAAVAMLVADWAVSSLVVVALVAVPALLLAIPVAAVVLPVALAALSRAITGRRNAFGSVTVTVLLAGVGAYGFANGILAPIGWLTDLPLHLLVCTLCALALGAFLRPWPLRVTGAAAAVAVLALMSSLPTSAEVAEVQRAEWEAQHRQEAVDYLLDHGAHPVVTELPGWTNPRIHPTGGSAMTWVRSDAGAVAMIMVQADADEPLDDNWCRFIIRAGESDAPRPGALPEWCSETDAGWMRTDGTATVFYDDGRLIRIEAAGELDVEQAGGTSSATPDDVAELAGNHRPMTRAELERYVLPVYDSGDTPVIDTPGL